MFWHSDDIVVMTPSKIWYSFENSGPDLIIIVAKHAEYGSYTAQVITWTFSFITVQNFNPIKDSNPLEGVDSEK